MTHVMFIEDGKIVEPKTELRWVNCEACAGSGEIIHSNPHFGHQEPDEYSELCGACEGTGRDCVAVSPITVDDLDQSTT